MSSPKTLIISVQRVHASRRVQTQRRPTLPTLPPPPPPPLLLLHVIEFAFELLESKTKPLNEDSQTETKNDPPLPSSLGGDGAPPVFPPSSKTAWTQKTLETTWYDMPLHRREGLSNEDVQTEPEIDPPLPRSPTCLRGRVGADISSPTSKAASNGATPPPPPPPPHPQESLNS